MLRATRGSLLLGLLSWTAACYSYVPVAVSGIRTGDDAKVNLTPYGQSELTKAVGGDVTSLSGKIVARDSAGFLMAVREVERTMSGSGLLHGENVRIPADAVSTAVIKKLSTGRTLLLGGAIVVGGVVLLGGLGDDSGPGGGGGPSNPI